MSRAPLPRRAAHLIACAIVAAEVKRLRENDLSLPQPHDWPESSPIGEEGLGLDSLERLGALGALSETFDLDENLLEHTPPRTVGAWVDLILRRQAAGGGWMRVRTSGSTGDARACVHATADLVDEAAFLASRFAGTRRVVALVPAHHIYGMIWAALLPSVLDVPVVARTAGAALGLAAGDLVVAVPDQWRAMLRITPSFPPDVVGVSSAGPLDDLLAADLLAAGLSRLVDIYGSSETGGIAMRDLPTTAYDLLPRWRLLPDGDGDWRLGDDHGKSHDLPDHVERIGDRGLRPVGRRDGAVQVGGHNVWPGRVAGMLREIDGVAEAAVRLHANGRLKAFIVPDPTHDPAGLHAAITQAVARRLTGPEQPKSLRFGIELPRNEMGKPADWT